MAPEELQGLALAPAGVEQHQHAAGPGKHTLGAAGCKHKPEEAVYPPNHYESKGHNRGTGVEMRCLRYLGNGCNRAWPGAEASSRAPQRGAGLP